MKRRHELSYWGYYFRIWFLTLTVFYGFLRMLGGGIYIDCFNLYVVPSQIWMALWWTCVVNTVLSLLITCKRSYMDVVVSTMLPFALYAVLYDMQYSFWFGVVCLGFSILLSIFTATMLLWHIKKIRIKMLLHMMKYTMFVVLAIPFCASFFFHAYGNIETTATISTNSDIEMEDNSMIKNEFNTLKHLADGSWGTLSTQEKLDVLQTVVNVESTYLGCTAMPLIADELGEYTASLYDNEEEKIRINYSVLLYEEPESCVNTVVHETRHRYQNEMVQAVNWDQPNASTLLKLSEVNMWKENIENYSSVAVDGSDAYYFQIIEVDARDYAKMQTPIYFEKLQKLMSEE